MGLAGSLGIEWGLSMAPRRLSLIPIIVRKARVRAECDYRGLGLVLVFGFLYLQDRRQRLIK